VLFTGKQTGRVKLPQDVGLRRPAVAYVVAAVMLAIGVPLLPPLYYSLVRPRLFGIGDLDAHATEEQSKESRMRNPGLVRPRWLDWIHVPMVLAAIFVFPPLWFGLFCLMYRGYLSTLPPSEWAFPSGECVAGCFLPALATGFVTGALLDWLLTRLLLGRRGYEALLDYEQARTNMGLGDFAWMWLVLAGPFGVAGAVAVALTMPTHERVDEGGIGLRGVASLSETYYPYEQVRKMVLFEHRFKKGKVAGGPYLVVTFTDGQAWEPRVPMREREQFIAWLEAKTGKKVERDGVPPGGPRR
jgi:hypothetical protein